MKDVCFVYPNTATQGRLGTHLFDLVLPPLGIAYLAAVLEQQGKSVEIVDANAELLPDDELLSRLRGRFRIVGFYCHTQNYARICELAAVLKKSESPPKVIIGGPHATALPEDCLRGCQELDALVVGEGEATIVELVEALLSGKELEGIQGVAFAVGGEVVQNAARPYIQDLDSIPMPAWHLLPMHRYRNIIESGGRRVVQLMGSRGCPSDCNYCFSTKLWSSKVRWHSAERVLAEVEHLRSHYGIQFFQFLDDIFTLNRERFRTVARALGERRLHWCCSTRADQIDAEVLEYLELGRVHHICIGIETVNDRLLQVIGKRTTKAEIIRGVDLCADHGIDVLGLFILGIPSETHEEAVETIRFALEHRFFFVVFSHMTIYPGTNFWTQLSKAEALSKDFGEYCMSKSFSYVEKHRTVEELEGLMRKAYLSFYTRPRAVLMLVGLMLQNPRNLLRIAGALLGVLFSLIKRSKKRPQGDRVIAGGELR